MATSTLSDDTAPQPDLQSNDGGQQSQQRKPRINRPPRVTAHGTYLTGDPHGIERLDDYQQDGYHPIHLGDCLGHSGRYRVIHKLGHGGFGTVWLCRDSREEKYVAVKVMTADVSPEGLVDISLEQLDQSAPGANYVAIPLDHFSLDGPNGTHQCVVLPLLGPRVSPEFWTQLEDPPLTLRNMCRQATQALAFLHKNSLCHGDFRVGNILVKIADLSHLSEDELLSLIGQPRTCDVLMASSEDLPPSTPRYLVRPADLTLLSAEYLTDQIYLIDFGEAYSMSSPPLSLGIPEHYLPPEILIDGEEAPIGVACDIWALGCTIFEIRRQFALFYMIDDRDELLAEMVTFFGKLPDHWWQKWEAREEYFNEAGEKIDPEADKDYCLTSALEHPNEIIEPGNDGKHKVAKRLTMSDEEQTLLEDLLRKLLRFEPKDRLGVEASLEHDYFKF